MTRKTRLKHLRAIVPPWLDDVLANTVSETQILAVLAGHPGSREKYWDDQTEKVKWFNRSASYREVNIRSGAIFDMVNAAKEYVEVPDGYTSNWEALFDNACYAVLVEFVLIAIRRGGYLLPADFRRSKNDAYLRFYDGGPSCYTATWSPYHRLRPRHHKVVLRWWKTLSDTRREKLTATLLHFGTVMCGLSGVPIISATAEYRYYTSSYLTPNDGVALKDLVNQLPNMIYCQNTNRSWDDRDYEIVEYMPGVFSRREELHEWEDGTLHDHPDPSGELTGYHSECRSTHDVQPYDLGVENEVKFLTSDSRKQAVRTMQGKLGMICERDGSLCSRTGVEIVQRKPKSLEDTIAEWTPVLGLIPTQTCLGYGMHVNICSDGWERDQLANFVGFWSINEDFVKYISKRSYGNYCLKSAPHRKEPHEKLSDSYSKYRACCVHSDSRVEVRIFRGTHSLELFSARCQIVDAVARWADEIDCSVKAVSQINGPGDSLLNFMKDNESRYKSAIKCVRNWVKLRTRTGVLDADGVYIEPPPPPTPPAPFRGSRPVQEDGVLRGCVPVMDNDVLACPMPCVDLGYFIDANQVAFFCERPRRPGAATYQVPYTMRGLNMYPTGVDHDEAYVFGTWETIGHMNGCAVQRWVPRVDGEPTQGSPILGSDIIWDPFVTDEEEEN